MRKKELSTDPPDSKKTWKSFRKILVHTNTNFGDMEFT